MLSIKKYGPEISIPFESDVPMSEAEVMKLVSNDKAKELANLIIHYVSMHSAEEKYVAEYIAENAIELYNNKCIGDDEGYTILDLCSWMMLTQMRFDVIDEYTPMVTDIDLPADMICSVPVGNFTTLMYLIDTGDCYGGKVDKPMFDVKALSKLCIKAHFSDVLSLANDVTNSIAELYGHNEDADLREYDPMGELSYVCGLRCIASLALLRLDGYVLTTPDDKGSVLMDKYIPYPDILNEAAIKALKKYAKHLDALEISFAD